MKKILIIIPLLAIALCSKAQELQARVTINRQQVQGTDASVFENLQQTLEQFINETQWTSLQFQKNERIQCNFNITVTKYDASSNLFTCNALIQANRPVYNSSYTTTLYNNRDNNFDFEFAQFDQLNFNEEQIDNQLVALTAYYAKTAFGDYKQGQLIVDTNDPFNRMVKHNKSTYKYEGNDGGENYSKLIRKSQVTVKQYKM